MRDPAWDGWVVLGATPWDTPWVEQNLAYALARRAPMVYVDPPVSPLTPFRHGLSGRTRPALRRLAQRRRPGPRDSTIVGPLAVPPVEHPLARRLSAPIQRRALARAVRAAGIERPVVVSTGRLASYAGAAGELARVFIVLDWFEEAGELIGMRSERVLADVDANCAAADLVICISEALRETLAARGIEAVVLRHGFPADLVPLFDAAEPPPEYVRLSRPILTFTGRLDGRLDVQALTALARRPGGGTVVLVGPLSPHLDRADAEKLRREPGIELLGERDREELPRYLAHADCLLIPYAQGSFARHGSPTKLGEYFYAGPPVVGSGYLALREYEPLLRFAGPEPEALPAAVDAALAEDGPAARQARRAHALENTWDDRAARLAELVGEHTRRRTPAG